MGFTLRESVRLVNPRRWVSDGLEAYDVVEIGAMMRERKRSAR